MTITTNRQWRNFLYRHEVPAAILASEFGYLTDDDNDGYFRYKGCWYHTSMFLRAQEPGWCGVHGDSYSSGVLINLSADGQQYQIATYIG